MLHVITVAFCPASQLARGIAEYNRFRSIVDGKIPEHTVVSGHYPINRLKNNRDIEFLCDSHQIRCLDPGSDLGSAQSQNWAIEKLGLGNNDYMVNFDPDSSCRKAEWMNAMWEYLSKNPECVLVSCWSKLWEPFKERLSQYGDGVGIAFQPVPFNLSMFRVSFIQQMGGLKQLGEKWGELEAVFHQQCVMHKKFHSYLMNYVENEDSKFMQDRQLSEYKDLSMRTNPPDRFVGSYEEYLRWKYPHLLEMDTYIDDSQIFK